jgi:hypothetical protein
MATEQSGFTPDPKNNDNSVNYLRRLKAETDAEALLSHPQLRRGQLHLPNVSAAAVPVFGAQAASR